MRSRCRKLSAAALSASFLLCSLPLSGCNLFKKQSVDQSLEVIKDSTPWYDLEKTMVDLNYEDSEYETVEQEYIGSIGGEAIFYVREYSNLPEGVFYESADLSLYNDNHLDFYSFSGEMTRSLDLDTILSPVMERDGARDVSELGCSFTVVGDKIMLESHPYKAERRS